MDDVIGYHYTQFVYVSRTSHIWQWCGGGHLPFFGLLCQCLFRGSDHLSECCVFVFCIETRKVNPKMDQFSEFVSQPVDDNPIWGLPEAPDDILESLCSGVADKSVDDARTTVSTTPDAPASTPPSKKRPRDDTSEYDDHIEVIGSGFIARAPIPIEQASALESSTGVEEGTYFVELMRKKVLCLRDMQSKWVSRACNRKKPKYIETQTKLGEFMDTVVKAFDSQFGAQSSKLTDPPTRKHLKARKSKK